jgi:hypothetical protein
MIIFTCDYTKKYYFFLKMSYYSINRIIWFELLIRFIYYYPYFNIHRFFPHTWQIFTFNVIWYVLALANLEIMMIKSLWMFIVTPSELLWVPFIITKVNYNSVSTKLDWWLLESLYILLYYVWYDWFLKWIMTWF